MKTEKPGRHYRRGLLLAAGALFLLLAAAQFWLIPNCIRSQVDRNLPDYWQGKAEIHDIDFSFFGPVVLRGVTLFDQHRQRWLYADAVTLKLDRWPGIAPVLTQIDIDQPELQLYLEDGRCRPPILPGPDNNSDQPNKYVDLKTVTIRNISVAAVNKHGLKKTWNDLQFSAFRQGPVFNLRLTRLTPDGANNLLFGGTIDPDTLETRLALEWACLAEKQAVAPILALLNIPLLRQAEGRLMANITLSGKLSDLANLNCRGTVNLNDWNLALFHDLDITRINTLVKIADRRADFQNLTAETCLGSIQGSLYAKFPQRKPIRYGGKLTAENIDLNELTDGINQLPKINQGSAIAHYTFDLQGNKLDSLSAYGLLVLDNAHLWNLPVVFQIFDQFKINNRDPLSTSDVAAIFAMNGPQTLFHHAVLANAISAIEMEPGGRVNLQTHQVNLYVIGVPLKILRKFISAIPLVKLIIPLRDRFSRLHLKGSWNDPPATLIFKEPFKQLQKDTEDFLKSAAQTEGQFNKDTLDSFKRMFDDLTRKKPPKAPTP